MESISKIKIDLSSHFLNAADQQELFEEEVKFENEQENQQQIMYRR